MLRSRLLGRCALVGLLLLSARLYAESGDERLPPSLFSSPSTSPEVGRMVRSAEPESFILPAGSARPGHMPRIGSIAHRVRRWLPRLPLPEFVHSDVDDPYRHTGKGSPLLRSSWLNRPFHVDVFLGSIFGDELIDGRVDQGNDIFWGVRIGWDFDHYWGTEFRAGFAEPDIVNSLPPTRRRSSSNEFFDFHLIYYPWGDARVRPYAGLGVGLARFNFTDDTSIRLSASLFHLPLSVGIKYYFTNWIVLRFDLTDNIAFESSGVDSMNNISLTAGTEFRFGGSRRSYYPFHP